MRRASCLAIRPCRSGSGGRTVHGSAREDSAEKPFAIVVPVSGFDLEDDLANMTGRLDAPMGGGGVMEGVFAVEDDLDCPSGDHGPDVRLDFGGDAGFGEVRLGAEGRAGHRQAAGHQFGEGHFGFCAVQEGDLDQTAVVGQRLEILLDIRAADHVEDEIHAAEFLKRG